MRALSGKMCALTGAASGIGRGPAPKLADEGCNPALADFNENGVPPLPETFEKGRLLCIPGIDNQLIHFLTRFVPRRFTNWLAWFLCHRESEF